jgi:hypothetical protein
VLLPGLEPFEPADLPPYLATRTWIDLREGPDSERGLRILTHAILGLPAGSGKPLELPDAPCPYRGLEVFGEEDARFYFGREAYVQRLLEKLKQARFVAVVGPSGSGKSSLVRAGLLPRLRAGGGRWRILVVRPGGDPLAALAGGLLGLVPGVAPRRTADELAADERALHVTTAAALADDPAGIRVLVLVDQCEELFTLCRDDEARAAFLHNLHYAAMVPGGRTTVVLTLRADFYVRLVQFPAVAQLVQSHQMLVGGWRNTNYDRWSRNLRGRSGSTSSPVSSRRSSPTRFANPGRCRCSSTPCSRPGTAVMETRSRSRATARPVGCNVASPTAPRRSTPTSGRSARMRLTQPGEGTEDTRRQASLQEVLTGGDGEMVSEVVHRFVDARLLTTNADETTGEQSVEVSHEALIRGWPRLGTRRRARTRLGRGGPPRSSSFLLGGVVIGWMSGGAATPEFSLLVSFAVLLVAGWVRVEVAWSVAEAVRGHYDWRYADRLVARATAHGLRVLAVLSSAPVWARPAGTSQHGAPLDAREFARFTRDAVARYVPQGVHTWEIWNEPNTSDFWEPAPDAARYSVLLSLSAAAVHNVDPGALVLSGGLTPGSTLAGHRIAPLAFLRALYDNAAMSNVGAVAIHPYTFPEDPTAPNTALTRLPLVRDLMVERGDVDKKVWLTEFGAPTGTGDGAVPEAAQATMLLAGFRRALAWDWVGGIFIYQLRDEGTDPADLEQNFGLLRHDYSPKPAWSALQVAIRRPTS